MTPSPYKIRVLIVDDSIVMRHLLAQTFAADPVMEIVGFASNGRLALEKIATIHPDIVTLDIEMPEMNGMEALVKIHQAYPKLPVIMISSINPRTAVTTVDALALGASDYVIKPAEGGKEETDKILREELIPKIKALCTHRKTPTRASLTPALSIRDKIDIIAIGISTGGPNALTEVLSQLPAHLPVPIVIVQHMPPMFTKLLAERLSTKCPFLIKEAASGDILLPGRAWLAAGDFHMEFCRDGADVRIVLSHEPAENACRPSVDVLFRSISKIYGAGVLAVIMTGMGNDGLRGCRQIRERGGHVIAQDEATSVVWGMPGAVVREGLADKILPLPQIAQEIIDRVRYGHSVLPI